MSQIYNKEGDSQNAETASEKALECAQRLYCIDKQKNASTLRMALMFAMSYNQNKPSSVIDKWNKQYQDLLYSSGTVEEGDEIMDILFGTMGQVNQFLSQGKTNMAKRTLKDAIYRLQPLYDKDEQKYGNPLSLFSFFLGSLHYEEEDFTTAQTYLEKGQQILRLEYSYNHVSQTIEPIVMGLMMLGNIKSNFGYREEADSLFASALEACDLISQKDEPYKPDVVKITILHSQFEHFNRYKEIDLSIKTLETILKLDSLVQQFIPDSCAPPYEWVGRYELAKLYCQKKRYVEAKNILIPCMILYSDDVTPEQMHDAQLLFVDLLIKSEKYEGALQFIDGMDEEHENDKLVLLYYKSVCYHALGKEKKAKKIWNSIRHKIPEDLYNNSPFKSLFDSNK